MESGDRTRGIDGSWEDEEMTDMNWDYLVNTDMLHDQRMLENVWYLYVGKHHCCISSMSGIDQLSYHAVCLFSLEIIHFSP